jgi:uncharacterized protein YycO
MTNPTNLKTGDVLHCSGNRLLSKIIKAFTRSKFSHTALFIEIWGQPYIIDAQADGVNVRPFDEWQKKYDYDIVAHRFSGELDREALSKRAMTKVGHTGYDIEGLVIRQPHKIFTGKWKEKGDTTERMYCSEFVAWVYGVERAYRMSPEDLYLWCTLNQFEEIKM